MTAPPRTRRARVLNGWNKIISILFWPEISPDLSAMDYSINEILKRRLSKRKSRGLPY
jgi:hypothetical protein